MPQMTAPPLLPAQLYRIAALLPFKLGIPLWRLVVRLRFAARRLWLGILLVLPLSP